MPGSSDPRLAARLIVRDRRSGDVLLFRYLTDDGPCWATPGGGLLPGEDFVDAARREAREEVWSGFDADVSPLWEETVPFIALGAQWIQHQRFFLADVTRELVDRPSDDVAAARKAEGVVAARWWSVAQLVRTDEVIHPRDLATRLRRLGTAR